VEATKQDLGNPHRVVAKGSIDSIRSYLDEGLDPDKEDDEGNTLLMSAIRAGRAEVVSLLIERDADVNSPNDEGVTPLMLSVLSGELQIAEIIGEHGGDVSDQDRIRKKTALMLAVERGDRGLVRLLLSYESADVHQVDIRRASALFLSSYFDVPSISEDLLFAGAEVDQEDMWGRTPLMVASMFGNVRTVLIMLEHGADPNTQTHWSNRIPGFGIGGPAATGQSALMFATMGGYADVVRALLNHGARIDLRDRDLTTTSKYRTALDYAMEGSNDLVTMLLVQAGNGDPLPELSIAETGPPYEIELTTTPYVVDSSSGVYHDAQKTGVTHVVPIRVWVDSTGTPKRGHALGRTNHFLAPEAVIGNALSALESFKFSPGYIGTRPVDCWTVVDVQLRPLTFSIIRQE